MLVTDTTTELRPRLILKVTLTWGGRQASLVGMLSEFLELRPYAIKARRHQMQYCNVVETEQWSKKAATNRLNSFQSGLINQG